jgi:hypothetical protein
MSIHCSETRPRERTGSRLLGLMVGGLAFLGACQSSGCLSADVPMPSTSGLLHEYCSSHADCQNGLACLTWSYKEKGALGLKWTVQGGSCEFPCKVDSDCAAPMQCLINTHTGVSSCQ